MSSDDAIYVLETPAECVCGASDLDSHDVERCPVAFSSTQYRVKHVIGGYWENEDEMLAEFADILPNYDEGTALVDAHKLCEELSEVYPVEYGVKLVRAKNPVPIPKGGELS